MIQKRQLSNGLRVWIVEQHELPVVQMSLVVLAGTDADPPGRYGTASLASGMLTEGAGSRSAVEIADALDALVANIAATTDVDSTSLQLYVPVLQLPEALAVMADAAQRPTFPAQELETLRQQRLATLRNARENPDAIAALAFARSSYGTHRSGAPLIGTVRQHSGVDRGRPSRLSWRRLSSRQQRVDCDRRLHGGSDPAAARNAFRQVAAGQRGPRRGRRSAPPATALASGDRDRHARRAAVANRDRRRRAGELDGRASSRCSS